MEGQYLGSFMRRHSNKLSLRRPTGTCQRNGLHHGKCLFSKILIDEFETQNYSAGRVEESTLSSKISQNIDVKISSLILSFIFMSTGRHFVPHLVTFPRKNFSPQLIKFCSFGRSLFRYSNIHIIKKARYYNVSFVCLPPHSTHKLTTLVKSLKDFVLCKLRKKPGK